MKIFKLDISGQSGSALGTLVIAANSGTNSGGFGWDMIALGMNTGGIWRWEHTLTTGFFISLTEKAGGSQFPFGQVLANWNLISNPNGFPPEPWFSQPGVNSGTLEVINFSSKAFNWRLR